MEKVIYYLLVKGVGEEEGRGWRKRRRREEEGVRKNYMKSGKEGKSQRRRMWLMLVSVMVAV